MLKPQHKQLNIPMPPEVGTQRNDDCCEAAETLDAKVGCGTELPPTDTGVPGIVLSERGLEMGRGDSGCECKLDISLEKLGRGETR